VDRTRTNPNSLQVDPRGRPSRTDPSTRLPGLPLEDWAASKDTLHLWLQVVGKIKLAYAPPRNHRWHVTLYLDLRGLTTGRVPVDETNRFEIRFDLVDHFVSIVTSAGTKERLDLQDGMFRGYIRS
jgi:hypothetical protein